MRKKESGNLFGEELKIPPKIPAKQAPKQALGTAGENIAADYLIQKGWTIRARNYRFQAGEIDLIAQTGTEIVFVEVKTRTDNQTEYPEAAVTKKKIRTLGRCAMAYIEQNDLWETPARFDVVAITWTPALEIVHIEDAFRVEIDYRG